MQRRTKGVWASAGSSNSLHASRQPSGSDSGSGLQAAAHCNRKLRSPVESASSAACCSLLCRSSTLSSACARRASASVGAASLSMCAAAKHSPLAPTSASTGAVADGACNCTIRRKLSLNSRCCAN
eukprot:1678189-Prymnesium_polylepis.1